MADHEKFRWLLIRVPLIAYAVIAVVCIALYAPGGIIVAMAGAVVLTPWLLFARWVCREIEKSERFNHRI